MEKGSPQSDRFAKFLLNPDVAQATYQFPRLRCSFSLFLFSIPPPRPPVHLFTIKAHS